MSLFDLLRSCSLFEQVSQQPSLRLTGITTRYHLERHASHSGWSVSQQVSFWMTSIAMSVVEVDRYRRYLFQTEPNHHKTWINIISSSRQAQAQKNKILKWNKSTKFAFVGKSRPELLFRHPHKLKSSLFLHLLTREVAWNGDAPLRRLSFARTSFWR